MCDVSMDTWYTILVKLIQSSLQNPLMENRAKIKISIIAQEGSVIEDDIYGKT